MSGRGRDWADTDAPSQNAVCHCLPAWDLPEHQPTQGFVGARDTLLMTKRPHLPSRVSRRPVWLLVGWYVGRAMRVSGGWVWVAGAP